jgi:Flp pilus assembly protein TadD
MVNKFTLIFVILIIYGSLCGASLLNWDDPNHLINNPATEGLSFKHMYIAFTQPVQQVYMPLTSISFAVERYFFGLNPLVFHLVNIVLHMMNSLLVLSIGARLGLSQSVAMLAAFIFAVHPMRVESVAWVTERKDVLCALFYFLSLRQYLIYLSQLKRRDYLLTLAWALFALLAKPMAISIGLMLFVIDSYQKRKLTRRLFIEKLPFIVSSMMIGYLTYQHHQRWPINNILESTASFTYTAFFYIKQFFIPYPLTPLHVLPSMQSEGWWAYIFSAIGLLCIIYSVWRWRNQRLWLLALGMYVVATFFLFRYDPHHDINVVADRFMYIPTIGLCFWLAAILHRYKTMTVIVIGVLMVISSWYAYQWRNDESIYSWAVKMNPNQDIAYNNRAGYYLAKNQYQLALDDYNRVLVLKPNNADTLFNRALTYQRMGEHQLAIADFNEVLTQYPSYARGLNQRGISYMQLGQYQEAQDDYNLSIMYEPNDAKVYFNRGLVLQKMGQYQQAISDYDQALRLDSRMVKAYNNRGVVYVKLRLYDQARQDFNQALLLDQHSNDAQYNLDVLEKLQDD